MDLGSIFIILALFLLVGLYISRPLFDRRLVVLNQDTRAEQNQREQDLSALMAERDRILNALQELDFDHVLGKVPEEVYPRQRQLLMQRGADVLRQLDELDEGETLISDLDTQLEAAIEVRKEDAARLPLPVSNGDDDIETMLAARRRVRQEKSAGFCPQCGGTVHQSDRFCPKCGTTL